MAKPNKRIQDIPTELRPREKAKTQGIESLSDAELLALFIGNGMAGENAIEIGQRLLNDHSSLSDISTLSIAELKKAKGLGPAKSTLMAAAFEIGKRVAHQTIQKVPLKTPDLIYEHVKPMFIGLTRESLRVILVNSKMHCLKVIEVSKGTTNQTICHPRDVLHHAIVHQAHGIILIHNHPSGDPTPSRADLQITREIASACEIMKVKFHDHLIVGQPAPERAPYYSFRENGRI